MARIGWLAALVVMSGCGKKNVETEPIVGWHQGEEWSAECYFPPNYDELGVGDRRIARQKVLEELMTQWSGERGNVSFPDDVVTSIETVLLGEPEHIEEVSIRNADFCRQVAAEGASSAGWKRYLAELPAKLTEGDCKYRPLDYTLFDYLDIGSEWQIPANVCEGNVVRIKGSTIDMYRITEGGELMNVAGDPSQPTSTTEWPCNIEGCVAGMLIMRFTGDSGVQTVIPVGTETVFTAPEHGRIEVQINDHSWFDNSFQLKNGIEDHTSIEYSPAE